MRALLSACFFVLAIAGCHNKCENGTGSGGAGGGVECGFTSECDPTKPPHEGKEDCDDDNPNSADRCIKVGDCLAGVCAHVLVECDTFDPIETQKVMCDDLDECTEDRCGKSNVCDHSTIGGWP